jgi:ketosteroid isomerase-like protein
MFSNGSIQAEPEQVRRLQTHSAAVHSVVERIRVMTDEGPQSVWVAATNVYVQTAMGWRMVAHHASPGSPREIRDIVETGSVLH